LKKNRLLLLVVCVLSMVTIVPAIALADADELVVYTGMGDKEIVPMQDAFKRDTGMTVKALSIPIGQATTRVKAENGRPLADVLMAGSIENYQELTKLGLLLPYKSPNAKVIDEDSKDPQGNWTGFYRGILGLVINEEAFKKELPGVPYPTSWDDLLNPVYKGKYVHTNPASSGAALTFIGDQIFRFKGDEAKAWEFMKGFTKNVGNYQNSSFGPSNLIATGEYPIGLSWTQDAMMKNDEGYKLKIIVPKESTFEISGIAILKGTNNLKMAQRFVDWVLTAKEGTRFSELSHRYSIIPGVPPPQGMLPFASLKLVNYDFEFMSSRKDRVIKQFTELMNSK
jgi:iron(III) transport system substrate-binding protein